MLAIRNLVGNAIAWGPTGGQVTEADHRQRLVQFYKQHNPAKISTVDKLLQDFKGREDFMFAMLHHKYVIEGFVPGSDASCVH